MAQKHDVSCIEKPMTVATTEQGPQKRYRRLRFPSFDAVVWAEKNPLLQKGELGHEKDTGRFKVGDGVTYWLDLPYNSVGEQGEVGPQGEKGDPAKINGYNTITIQNGNNIDLQQEENVLTISTKNIYNQTEIDDKVTVINTAIDANADAIQTTREDYIEADSEIHQILNAHASELTTQRNDIDGLGDQVSGIESKIPESASAENPLVTRSEISSVYKFKGSVATYNDLPAGAAVGDVYNVTDTGANYAWDGSAWDKLSETVDLSSYATTAYVNAREQDIRDDYMQADSDLQTQINGQATAIAGIQDDITEINDKISSSASSTNKLISASELAAESQDIRSDYIAADSELQTQINGLSSAVVINQSDISTLRTDVGDLENQVEANHNDITAHIADTSNPHNVTKTQVGLSNVDNTSDANKPVSIAQQASLNLKADKSTTYSKTEVDDLLAPKLDSETAEDTYATITNLSAHTSNTSNPHSVTKTQVGLGNVDNTSDLNKPVSTAQQTAINTAKQDVISGYTTADGELQQQINGQATAISTNTSNITALTTRVGTNETNIALLDSDVGAIDTDLATAKTDITNLKSSVNSQAGLIQGLQDDVSEKVDKNQGTANAGKILSVGSDGQITLTAAPGGGLTAVVHDSTLTGTGTDTSPLGIASTVLAEIADKAEQTTVETLSGVVSQNTTNIGTLRTDVDDLGDQVSGIESKIPESTSTTNQLVNATQLATKADTDYVDTQLATKQPVGDYATNSALASGLALKVAIAQGAENAGKILKIDDNGNVIVADESGGASLPILYHTWSDHVINDMSWLRADTFSWQSGDVYKAAYEHLVNDYDSSDFEEAVWGYNEDGHIDVYTKTGNPQIGTTVYDTDIGEEVGTVSAIGDGYIDVDVYGDTKRFYRARDLDVMAHSDTIGDITITYALADDGHKICLPDQEDNISALYESTGVAWYYILDTDNQQFKLPRAKPLSGAIMGNGMALGLTDGTNNAGLNVTTGTDNKYLYIQEAYGESVGATTGSTVLSSTDKTAVGITTDGTKSGIVAERENTDQYKYLYFYVGNFEQSAIEQTAGLNAESFNGKADTDLSNIPSNYDYVIESQEPTEENGRTWYRLYKSGWVEQGGYVAIENNSNATVALPIEMNNTSFNVVIGQQKATVEGFYYNQAGIVSKATTYIVLTNRRFEGSATYNMGVNWQVSGMSAQ